MYNFDATISRKGTGCRKWDSLNSVFGHEDVLPFWIADMDFAAPPGVVPSINFAILALTEPGDRSLLIEGLSRLEAAMNNL